MRLGKTTYKIYYSSIKLFKLMDGDLDSYAYILFFNKLENPIRRIKKGARHDKT